MSVWSFRDLLKRASAEQVSGRRKLLGGTPEATVYQASFCLLLYNVVTVMRGYVAAGAGQQAESISLEEAFKDVQRQLISWSEVFTVEETVGLLQGFPEDQLEERLRVLLSGTYVDRWAKTKGSGKTKPSRPKFYPKGGHTSIYKLLRDATHAPSSTYENTA